MNFKLNDLVDTLFTLFLKLVLAILLQILYIIKGEDVRVTKVEVTIKKANEEKRYTHIIDASKEREINPKELKKLKRKQKQNQILLQVPHPNWNQKELLRMR